MRTVMATYELVLGLVLLLAPWTRIWEDNWVFWRWRLVVPWIMSGAVRGAVSGLGAAFVISALGVFFRISLIDEGAPAPVLRARDLKREPGIQEDTP